MITAKIFHGFDFSGLAKTEPGEINVVGDQIEQ